MARQRPRPCTYGGCSGLRYSPDMYCSKHLQQNIRKESESRSSTARGYSYRWQKARSSYLKSHALCVSCLDVGRVTAATDVDHVIPHKLSVALETQDDQLIREAQSLFWNTSNWQALCKSCHSRKTVILDGGFGRGGKK